MEENVNERLLRSGAPVKLKQGQCCVAKDMTPWCHCRGQYSRCDDYVLSVAKQPSTSAGHLHIKEAMNNDSSVEDVDCLQLFGRQPKEKKDDAGRLLRGAGSVAADLPPVFSVLLNFGYYEGYSQILIEYEYDADQHSCGVPFIWDPYSQVCRRLVIGGGGGEFNAAATQVTLFSRILGTKIISNETSVVHKLGNALAAFCGVSVERVANVTITRYGEPVAIDVSMTSTTVVKYTPAAAFDFVLKQSCNSSSGERAVTEIVAELISVIADGRLTAFIAGTPVYFVGMREIPQAQDLTRFNNWCR